MSRRKYKKIKRKLSRKAINKTRRRTKNRVKKLSKNQSGGMIQLSIGERLNISSHTTPATKKRAKPSPLPDEELGQLVINSLFTKVTNVSFIHDSSLYGFILYATIPEGVLFDTRNLLLSEALDITTPDRGIPLQHFCMKISLVHNNSHADKFDIYDYTDLAQHTHSKRAVSVIHSTKEAHIQKKLYDSFACMSGTSPFVPDVIAHGVFNHEQFESYISLFMSNRLAAAPETGIDPKVLHVLREISDWLQQKNREDSRKTDASEKQNWAVDILLMEYIDTSGYQTLYTLGTKSNWFGFGNPTFKPSSIETALLTTAAQLACATGVGIILYDSHAKNALSNTPQTHVVLVDIGGAIDYSDEDDKQFTIQTFGTMLDDIRVGANTFCRFEELSAFFGVEGEDQLSQTLEENLDSLVDFRCGQFTIDDIHHNLIMTAFVDFMMYIVMHKSNTCQSQYTMESVYGAGTFSNFSTFLRQFRQNDRTFRSSEKILLSKKSDINLSIVGQEISKIVELCSSVKCPINTEKLRLPYILSNLPPGQAPTQAQAQTSSLAQKKKKR